MQSDKSFEQRSRFRNYTSRSRGCYIRWGIIAATIAVILALTLSLTLTLGKGDSSPQNTDNSPTDYEDDMVLDKNFVAEGVNSFGSKLFSQVAKESYTGDAAFLSPWGIAHALAMLLEGAGINTPSYNQLREIVFSIPSNSFSAAAVRNAVQTISTNLVYSSNGVNLTVSDANSAWVAPNFPILESYVSALKTYYNAEAEPLTGADVVNNWVTNATNGKITSIIDEPTAAAASLLLVNAIYFKGMWLQPFTNDTTQPVAFNLLDGTSQDTAMMYMQYNLGPAIKVARLQAPLPENGGNVDCIAARMAYQGDQYSAVIAMPEGNLGAPSNGVLTMEDGTTYTAALSACRESVLGALSRSVGSNLNATKSDTNSTNEGLKWISVGDPEAPTIKVFLPRFEINFELSLAEALQGIGLTAIFSPGDFTGISIDAALAVSEVKHKVYVKVDEQGTEAAAVTGIVAVTSFPIEPVVELVVKFDRPFVFSIVHEDTGMALFAGEVYKPEKWAS